MGFIGSRVGGFLGDKISQSKFAKKRPGLANVASFGLGAMGSLSPYEKGGRVTRTEPALVHKGEYVLPKGVKPTKAQKRAVAKGKAKKPIRKAPVKRKGKGKR